MWSHYEITVKFEISNAIGITFYHTLKHLTQFEICAVFSTQDSISI